MEKLKTIIASLLSLIVFTVLMFGISRFFNISEPAAIGILIVIIISISLFIISPLFDYFISYFWPIIFISSMVGGFVLSHFNGVLIGGGVALGLYFLFKIVKFIFISFEKEESIQDEFTENQ